MDIDKLRAAAAQAATHAADLRKESVGLRQGAKALSELRREEIAEGVPAERQEELLNAVRANVEKAQQLENEVERLEAVINTFSQLLS